jgi:uncharacterized membrane protein
MNKLKTFYIVLGIFSILFGIFLILSLGGSSTGAVIGLSENRDPTVIFGFGIFFVLTGFTLLLLQYFGKRFK